ncbi:MAG: amidohydrolase family protein [Spirochaetota bacterium]|nr:MAG: amidohydrolase family protein [Spirochaetota bacterium]
MNKALKWVGIGIGIIVGLIIVFVVAYVVVLGPKDTVKAHSKTALALEMIPPGTEKMVAFENINVIPMDSERLLKGHTVIIEDGRISEMGPVSAVEIPQEALTVDGHGRFLIPGLSDMHAHLLNSENDLMLYIANGVTTIRDVGGPPIRLQWRDEINAGTRPGPNLWVWSPWIREMDWFDWIKESWIYSGGVCTANTPKKAEKLVAEFKAQGYDGIKVHNGFFESLDSYRVLMSSAHKYDLSLDGHVPVLFNFSEDKTRSWNEFRELGQEAVAHVEELIKIVDWTDESIQKTAKDVADDKIWVTTTIALIQSIRKQRYNLEDELDEMQDLKYVNPGLLNQVWIPGKNHYVADPERPKEEVLEGISNYIDAMEKMCVALNEEGALLMSGTDSNVPLMVPGFSLHDELEVIVDLGISTFDALKTSTYNPALYLNKLNEFGTIEIGKQADLVLLEANPLEDITNTRLIEGVMVRGRWYTRNDLDTILDQIAEINQEVTQN